MRFTLTMPDDLVEQIDEEAERTGNPRAEWIRTACTDALTTEAPEEPRPDPPELIDLRSRAVYLEQTIADLRADKEYLRGEIARVQQENSLLTHRLLPPPRAGGVVSRIRRWWSGSGEE